MADTLTNVELAKSFYGSETAVTLAFLHKAGNVDISYLKSGVKTGGYKDDPDHIWIDIPCSHAERTAAGINKLVGEHTKDKAIAYEYNPSKAMKPEEGVTLKVSTKIYEETLGNLVAGLDGKCKEALSKLTPSAIGLLGREAVESSCPAPVPALLNARERTDFINKGK